MLPAHQAQHLNHMESYLSRTLLSTSKLTLPPQTLSQLLQSSRHLLQTIQVLKMERRSYTTILQNNKAIQLKLNTHNSIISSIEGSFNDRIKVMAEEIKSLKEQLEKQRKYYNDKYDTVDKDTDELKRDNQELRLKVEELERRIGEMKGKEIEQSKEKAETQMVIERLTKLDKGEHLVQMRAPTFQEVLISSVGPSLISFLSATDVKELVSVNRIARVAVLHSPKMVSSVFFSIVRTNKQRTRLLEKHVRYFQHSCERISQDVIQSCFYKYMILKKQIGAYMLPILTDCALLFDGKFVQNTEQLPSFDSSTDELARYSEFPIDKEIKQMYKEEATLEHQMISEEVYGMYKKIHNTAQLYSADVESIGLFLSNLEHNYSRLFVFSKKLCAEGRNLQLLNSYLLKEVTDRHLFELGKNSEIEDLKAQLESEAKIKNFFSSRSLNSDQRCLSLENQKLHLQMRLKEMTQKLGELQIQNKKEGEVLKEMQRKNQILLKDNKAFKSNFDQVHGKYTKIMQELEILRDNLQKMTLAG